MDFELSKFGHIRSIRIPRPIDLQTTPSIKDSAVGKVFVEFDDVCSAFIAYNLLDTLPFNGEPVNITFFDPEQYLKAALS